MKRSWTLLLIVLFALAVCIPGFAAATLQCQGTKCGCGGGARNYSYTASCPGQNIVWVEIGVCDGTLANYINFQMPPGWNVAIFNRGNFWHNTAYFPKGQIIGHNGTCGPYIKFWDPNNQGVPNQVIVGYDHPLGNVHESDWDVGVNLGWGDWTKPIGFGLGPVHSPN